MTDPSRRCRVRVAGGSIFDGTRWHQDRDLVIENGLVAGITATASRCDVQLDARGCLVVPGFVDAHMHLFPGFVSRLPAFGVTAAVDMFSTPNVLDAVRRESVHHPLSARWMSAGVGVSVEGGHPRQLIGQGMYEAFPSLDPAGSVAEFVDARIDEGSAFLKVFLEAGRVAGQVLPVPDADIVRAVCQAAHRRGLRVIAHVTDAAGGLVAVRNGVDGLAHAVIPGPDDAAAEELVREIAERGVFVIPTLVAISSALGIGHGELFAGTVARRVNQAWTAHARHLGRTTADPAAWERTQRFVAELACAGVQLLAGTDAAFPGVVPGASLHVEVALLQSCGLPLDDVLTAVTSAPGSLFFTDGVGRLVPGGVGDVVVIDGDPQDQLQTQRLRAVVMAGAVVTSDLDAAVEEPAERASPVTAPSPIFRRSP